MSRYGIEVTNEQVREVIFKGLAGGEGDHEAIDIIEIVAILIIPMLVKLVYTETATRRSKILTAAQERLLPPANIIEDVLRNLIADFSNGKASLKNPPELTPNVLKRIFLNYDELELAKDDALIAEMIEMASGGKEKAIFNVVSFARALTNDVQLYNPELETRHTTILQDVFPEGLEDTADTPEQSDVEEEDKMENIEAAPEKSAKVNVLGTLSMIDFTSDAVKFQLHVILIWLIIVFTYFFYLHDAGKTSTVCNDDTFGCKVASSIVAWLFRMIKLV